MNGYLVIRSRVGRDLLSLSLSQPCQMLGGGQGLLERIKIHCHGNGGRTSGRTKSCHRRRRGGGGGGGTGPILLRQCFGQGQRDASQRRWFVAWVKEGRAHPTLRCTRLCQGTDPVQFNAQATNLSGRTHGTMGGPHGIVDLVGIEFDRVEPGAAQGRHHVVGQGFDRRWKGRSMPRGGGKVGP